MRTSISLILAFLWSFALQAQPTFEKYYLSTSSYKRNLLELPSGNILVSIAWGPGVSILSSTGDFLHSKCYWSDSVLTMQSIRRVEENNYLFLTGYRKDSCSSIGVTTIPFTHPAVGRMDSLGNVSSLKQYSVSASPCLTRPGDLYVTNDSGAIIWGRDTNFFALRIDASLNPQWSRRYLEDGGFHFIKELPTGDFIAGINLKSGGATVARMDAEGNIIWCKSYIRPKGVVHDAYIHSDGSFIVTGYTDSTTTSMFEPLSPLFQPKLFLMKLNGDGEVEWCRGFDSAPYYWHTPRWSRIVQSFDGNFVVAATLGTPGYNLPLRPLLMKLNTNGDTLWTNTVGPTGYLQNVSDLLVASDGGLLISGGIEGDLPENWTGAQFIYKADSLGRLPCWEAYHSVVTYDLFPNDSDITLTAIDGVTAHLASVSDTTFAPLTIYDSCTLNTGIPSMVRHAPKQPRVRPNPNTGRFTVQFDDPLMADSFYSVYDALGKLLYQQRWPPGEQTEEVDLLRFGTGTYVIRFTSPGGSCYERVVVE
ncbi:MAG: T9SS type A sorting domain-containing protein [Flavobacteriales bacterium]|nr:T9SS type A sorting domain-containing protein [Flavobacteriales bacterium]